MRAIRFHTCVVAVIGLGCTVDNTAEPFEGQAAAGGAAPSPPTSAVGTPSVATPPTAASSGATAATQASQSGSVATAAPAGPSAPQQAGSAPSTATPADAAPTTAPSSGVARAPGDPIPVECRGFDFNGLVYSPGGEVLPNKCEPFHPTLNNPYAVRCVDAWPWFKTQFAGDQYCVLPPTPEKGIQFGHHPQGEYDTWFKAVSQGDMSGYEMDKLGEGWTLEPGAEEERNINIRHMNMGGNYDRSATRMRGGSHHMIASAVTSPPAQTFVWGPGGPDGLFGGSPVPGAQRPDENTPQSAQIPAENVGLYSVIQENSTVTYNMHHFNPSDRVILKEAWQNIWWSTNPQTRVNGISGLPLTQAVETFANPGEIVDMHYSSTAAGPVRILSLFGHRHAWTTNFTAWVKRGGKEEVVYQSFDWFDEPTYQYNSEVKNPSPDHLKRTDGAFTGILNLEQGDELHFNCHIEYTEERAMEENSPVRPSQNGPLRFANQAFEAEMCILFGSAVGQNGSMSRAGAPPDFAKSR